MSKPETNIKLSIQTLLRLTTELHTAALLTTTLLATAVLAAALLTPTPAQADTMGLKPMKVSIHVSERSDSGEKIYYSCDYAEQVTKSMLKKLGAQEIKVRCTGGLDNFGHMPPMPVNLTARFLALNHEGNGVYATEDQDFRISYSDDCFLPSEVFNSLIRHFEASDVKRTSRCSSGRFARFSATGTVPALQ